MNASVPVEQVNAPVEDTPETARKVADRPEEDLPAAAEEAEKSTGTDAAGEEKMSEAPEETDKEVSAGTVPAEEERTETVEAGTAAGEEVADKKVVDSAVSEESGEEVSSPEKEESGTAGQPPVSGKAPAEAAPAAEEEKEGVDFADEDARLDAQAPEYDLGEENEEIDVPEGGEDASPASAVAIAGKSKEELVALFAALLETEPVQNLRKDAEAIKIAFYKALRASNEAARKAFAEAGGDPEEFKPETDPAELRLKELFGIYRGKRDALLATIEAEKEENYQAKLRIIEELKELVNSNETINQTFNTFRELQKRWKEAGVVPKAQIKDLWETYHLHVENFYNFVKINKELRDLDLKRNYESKIALCEEAEALILEPSVVNAFHKLQKLHEQWREVGPVANEYKEPLWDRFKEASTRVNKKHQEYFDRLKEEQKRNLDLKTELCVKTEELSQAIMTSRKDWSKASDELMEIQKVWKTIGFAPKKDNTKIYERFRAACDRFFENKRGFYLRVKSEMDNNLQLKTDLCIQAEALQESDDWKKTTDEFIALQRRWKETGPVPRKQSEAVWKRFRAACDRFFDRKSEHFAGLDSQYEENLAAKRALLEEIRAYVVESPDRGFEDLKAFQRRWAEIGFVPLKEKDALQKEYREVIDAHFAAVRGNDKDRKIERYREKISGMRTGGDRRMRYERDRLYNKVKQLEADIQLWENNIGFFAKSTKADSMIRDVQAKIQKAREERAVAIEKIRLIDESPEN